jgi:hypothetical protein
MPGKCNALDFTYLRDVGSSSPLTDCGIARIKKCGGNGGSVSQKIL